MSTFEQTATPANRRFLNVKLGDISTDINLRENEHLSEVQDAIKAKYGYHISAPPIDIYLELDDGAEIEDLDDIPIEYFLKRKDPKSKTCEIKVRPPPILPPVPLTEVIPAESKCFLNAIFSFQKRDLSKFWQFTHPLLRVE